MDIKNHLESLVSSFPKCVFILFCAIFPNVISAWGYSRLAYLHGVVNIDYILLGILVSFLRRKWIAIPLFIFFSLVDWLVLVSHIYHFKPHDLALSLRFSAFNPIKLSDIGAPLFILISVYLFFGSLFYFSVSKIKPKDSTRVGFVFLLCIEVIDCINGTSSVSSFYTPIKNYSSNYSYNIATSSFYNLDLSYFSDVLQNNMQVRTVDSAMNLVNESLNNDFKNKNVVLIVVESWGKLVDNDRLEMSLFSPFYAAKINEKYDFSYGTVPFSGTTTHAELRELCGIDIDYRLLSKLPRQNCIPSRMADSGYDITGIHGFYSRMFDRDLWWPVIGIQKSFFLDELEQKGLERKCGSAFPGACDVDVINFMSSILVKKNQFIYFLTLNSHLPIRSEVVSSVYFNCAASSIVLSSSQCDLVKIWFGVFDAVAHLALVDGIEATRFVVVGDHSPPFALKKDAKIFSSQVVPYFVLDPKYH